MTLKRTIRKGDTTTHGGIVLEGLDDVPIFDKPVACMGHMVYCPKCQGVYPIIEGIGGISMFGQPAAVEGMKTACGAELIASQDMFAMEVLERIATPFNENHYASYLVASLGDTPSPPTYDVKDRPKPQIEEKKYTRVTVMINDNDKDHGHIFGYHAGLMIGESGRSDSMIYDPSGSYDPCWGKNCKGEEKIGSNRTVHGKDTDFSHYIRYQKTDDKKGKPSAVFTFIFLVETKYIKEIEGKIFNQGGGGNYDCATFVSQALTNIPPFGTLVYSKPRYLKNRLIEIQKDLWTNK